MALPPPTKYGPVPRKSAIAQPKLVVAGKTFDSSNAEEITKSVLINQAGISKTQVDKNPYVAKARAWANHNRTVTFGDWKDLGRALKNPNATEAHLHFKPFSLLDITLTGYILDFLDDHDLAKAERVSNQFQHGAMIARLPPTKYGQVVAEGKRETVTISAKDHHSMAVDYYRRARQAKKIVLYRQFDKKARLNMDEIGKFTVSSFPWTPEKTAAWILGGIQSRKQFVVITDVSIDNLRNVDDNRVAVLGRELGQLLLSGYTIASIPQTQHNLSKLNKNLFVLLPPVLSNTRSRLEWTQIWNRSSTSFSLNQGTFNPQAICDAFDEE